MGALASVGGVTPLLLRARTLRSSADFSSGVMSRQSIIDRTYSLLRFRLFGSSEMQGSCRGVGMANEVLASRSLGVYSGFTQRFLPHPFASTKFLSPRGFRLESSSAVGSKGRGPVIAAQKAAEGGLHEDSSYRNTVELPQTTFSTKANSVAREPEIQKLWDQKQVLQKLQEGNTGNLGIGGDYQCFLPVSTVRSGRRYNQYPFAASGAVNATGNQGLGAQQVRTIMVEVKRNDLDRAIRRWRRKCKEENLRVLKDREYYIKPSEKRVLAMKERDRRVAKKAFKQKLNWIMSRRQRGF